jgi:multidrug resistance protein MdtO
MRVLGKLGLAFFVVALAVIYAQTFPSMTSQSEILVRLLLWLWVAINTAIWSRCWSTPVFSRLSRLPVQSAAGGDAPRVAALLARPDASSPPTFKEIAEQFAQLQSLYQQATRSSRR